MSKNTFSQHCRSTHPPQTRFFLTTDRRERQKKSTNHFYELYPSRRRVYRRLFTLRRKAIAVFSVFYTWRRFFFVTLPCGLKPAFTH